MFLENIRWVTVETPTPALLILVLDKQQRISFEPFFQFILFDIVLKENR